MLPIVTLTLNPAVDKSTLVEIVVTTGSDLVDETIVSAGLQEFYRAAVLAIRRGGETAYERLTDFTLRPGDVLFIELKAETVDIANGILFLTSDESKFMTGSELVIDRGYTAQ